MKAPFLWICGAGAPACMWGDLANHHKGRVAVLPGIDDFDALVKAVLDEYVEENTRYHVVGFSLGAAVATHIPPENIASLTLVAPVAAGTGKLGTTRMVCNYAFNTLRHLRDREAMFVRTEAGRQQSRACTPVSKDVEKKHMRAALRSYYALPHDELSRPDERVGLVVRGAFDVICSASAAKQVAERFKFTLETVPESSHVVPLDAPGPIAARVEEVLNMDDWTGKA